MSFAQCRTNEFSYLQYEPWLRQGLSHGFCDRSVNFAKDKRAESQSLFCSAFNTKELLLMRQAHTNSILAVDLKDKDYLVRTKSRLAENDFDGLLIKAASPGSHMRIGFGILSADCIPIIARSDQGFLLLHSGWRGLANRIVVSGLEALSSLGASSVLEVLLGPAAGGGVYEVGSEVISEIGAGAEYVLTEHGKANLDLRRTAAYQINSQFAKNVKIINCEVCTISNTQYYSYRREGAETGRNLSFLLI